MYRKIYWLPLLAIFLIITLAALSYKPGNGPPIFILVCSFAFVGWAILGRRIAYWMVPLFVNRFKCPGCGEEYNTVGVWNCSCGFKDHKERNILTKSCPQCGTKTGRTDCPKCNCTILLW
jgi:hypothetical protein